LRTLAREGSIDLRVAERFMTRQFRPALWLLALQSALVCTSTAIGADADTDACRSNLLIIYDAIQAYRQAHQDLPDRLSDLVQDYYLSDLSVLICPAARAQGITSYHVAKWTEAEMFDRGTTYLYEFGTNLIPNIIRGGSGRPMREWKRAQMSLVGGRIPMVRCLVHGAALNLSFDGETYRNQGDWENGFKNVIRIDDLTPTRLLAGGKTVRLVPVPPRDSTTPVWLIDLEEYYNASLSRSWCSPADANCHLGSLPTGIKTFDGTAFDVRGLIQVRCDKFVSVQFPVAVTNIPIGLRCKRLHFLHAAAWEPTSAARGTIIGFYGVHFDGGRVDRLPIQYGTHLIEWRSDPEDQFKKTEHSSVAWEGEYKSSSGQFRSIHLYRTTWINPSPDTLIRSLDFETAVGKGTPTASTAPFLVAVSADP